MIEFDDREFLAGLDAAVMDYAKQAFEQERQRANRIKDAARRYAPRATGELVESIEVEEGSDEDGPYFDVGTSVEHGTYQEFGTSVDPPRPFMRPAIAENSQ